MSNERASLVVAVSLFLVTLAVNLEAPLYPKYAEQAGVGGGITSLVFALYTVSLMFILTFFGGASDRIGRKRIIVLGLGASWLATVLMIAFPSMNALMIARLLQGAGVAFSVATSTAYLVELNPTRTDRVAMVVGMMTSFGFGAGALLTSLALGLGSTLVPISFWGVAMVTTACLVATFRLPEQAGNGESAWVRLPYYNGLVVKMGFLLAMAWAVTGLIIAVLPLQLNKYGLAQWAGVVLFTVNGVGALVQPIARRVDPLTSLRVGFIVVPLGYSVLVFGAWTGVLGLIIVGAAIAGMGCYGLSYYGSLSQVTRYSPAEHRARATSGFLMIAYVGFSLPSVLIGYLSESIGIIPALVFFGALIVLTSLFGALRVKAPA